MNLPSRLDKQIYEVIMRKAVQKEIPDKIKPRFFALCGNGAEKTQSKTPLVVKKYPSKDDVVAFIADKGCIEELKEDPIDREELNKYLNSYRYHFEQRGLREYLAVHVGYGEKSSEFAESILTNLFPNLTKADIGVYIPESGRMSDRVVVFPMNDAARNILKMQ